MREYEQNTIRKLRFEIFVHSFFFFLTRLGHKRSSQMIIIIYKILFLTYRFENYINKLKILTKRIEKYTILFTIETFFLSFFSFLFIYIFYKIGTQTLLADDYRNLQNNCLTQRFGNYIDKLKILTKRIEKYPILFTMYTVYFYQQIAKHLHIIVNKLYNTF